MCKACETKAAIRARREVQQLRIGSAEYPLLTKYAFTPVVPWEQIQTRLGDEEYHRFRKWIEGQEATPDGVYPWDLERFLRGLPPKGCKDRK